MGWMTSSELEREEPPDEWRDEMMGLLGDMERAKTAENWVDGKPASDGEIIEVDGEPVVEAETIDDRPHASLIPGLGPYEGGGTVSEDYIKRLVLLVNDLTYRVNVLTVWTDLRDDPIAEDSFDLGGE